MERLALAFVGTAAAAYAPSMSPSMSPPPSYAPSPLPTYGPTACPTLEPVPSYAPSASPPPTPQRECTDVESKWMDDNGYDCENAAASYFVDKCTERNDWVKKHYCEQRCAELGMGYVDIACDAPSRAPTLAPSVAPTASPSPAPTTPRPSPAPTTAAPTRGEAAPGPSEKKASDGLSVASGGAIATIVLLLAAGAAAALCFTKGPSVAARACAGAPGDDAAGNVELAEAVFLRDTAPSSDRAKIEAVRVEAVRALEDGDALAGLEAAVDEAGFDSSLYAATGDTVL